MGCVQSSPNKMAFGLPRDRPPACLRALLIQRLERQGVEQPHMTGFLRELAKLLSVLPGMNLQEVNARLHYLGWTDVSLDYQSMQLAAACLGDH